MPETTVSVRARRRICNYPIILLRGDAITLQRHAPQQTVRGSAQTSPVCQFDYNYFQAIAVSQGSSPGRQCLAATGKNLNC